MSVDELPVVVDGLTVYVAPFGPPLALKLTESPKPAWRVSEMAELELAPREIVAGLNAPALTEKSLVTVAVCADVAEAVSGTPSLL